jgi:hypothetical protein
MYEILNVYPYYYFEKVGKVGKVGNADNVQLKSDRLR